jgi:hemerythrin-like metal-binding protein
MSFFEWSEKYDVHVDAMNDEHKRLIGYMNTLHELHEKNAAKYQLRTALKELSDYTLEHFSDEEKFMESIKFPQLSIHKVIHKSLLADLQKHVKDFEAGTGKLSESFFSFLKLWLTAHIQHIDVKYGTPVDRKKVD